VVALESTTLSLAKTIVQKAVAAWIADRRTAKEGKKELSALLTPRFPHAAPEQRFLDEAAAELASLGRYEFRGLDDGDREAALLAVRDAFTRADLTDRTLFAVDVDAVKLASRLRAGRPRAKTAAGLGEVGGAFYDAALDRCCELYVRAVVQVPAFAGRSLAEMLNRLSDLPDQVAARVVNTWRKAQAAVADQPDSDVTMAGWLLEEVTDPFVLEVHRPVQLADAPSGLPVLPPYEKREHDQVLGQVVRAAADGHSGIAVLVGESSTGKTRACWETLALLRDRDPPWRLWHPIDPSRPDAALRELPGIGPRTVVWLNEAQFYLDTADELGEQVAAGLRALLRDPARGPVLVLATLWPEYWHSLTARPAGGADRHPDARALLDGHDITVPPAFTPAQMSQLALAADARMALAARSAPDGEAIQFLAGAPELLARYRNAPPAAAALISAAMDARRLGMGAGLPRAFLEAAAPGYLTDARWEGLGEDWLEQALAYAAVPCKGVRGPLTRIRPRPASRAARDRGDQPAGTATAAGSLYRLADYLDQHGRAHRASQFPPAEFWSAAATHAPPGDQAALGDAAHDRGLYRDAAQLHKNAAASGNPHALIYLSQPLAYLPAAPGPAHWVAAHAPLDKPAIVGFLLGSLREAGAHEQAAALASRAAAHTPSTTRSAWPACWKACGERARMNWPPRCWTAIPPPTPPSTTRAAWPACWTACGERAHISRPPGWPNAPPPTPPSPTRAAWPTCWTACGRRAHTSWPPRWPAGPPPTPPSTTRAAWPACWKACGERAHTSRLPRCWTAIPPPTPPSPTRAPWPASWTACGERAHTSRLPRWPAGPPPSTSRMP